MKGQVAVIIDDTVDHKEYSRGKDVSPQGNYWICCHAHGRFERAKLFTVAIVDLSTGRAFMVGAFPYAVRKMLDLRGSPSSRPRSSWPDVGRAQGVLPVARVVFDPSIVREARDGQRGVKAQVQPSSGSARGTLEEVEGHLRVGELSPGFYYADLTLGGRVTKVKFLVQEYKR
ncbi:MAG: hypothetical protein RXN50_03555 [Sulfolobaceae archaeon]|nr:hypothetical protein [Sulfolobales archaeon]